MEPLCATILVLVVTNRRLILAADSRKTKLYPDGVKETGTTDKIYQTGDYYYAVSGFNGTEDDSFTIQAILHHVLLKQENILQAMKQIARIVTGALKNYFTALKKSSPALFAQLRKYNSSGGEIVIVKRRNSIPTACLLEYEIIDGRNIHVVMNTGHIAITKIQGSESCFWRAIGNTGFLHSQMPAEKEMSQHSVEKIKWIIEEGIRYYPDFVDRPINILEMTEESERWIEKSATAPNRVITS